MGWLRMIPGVIGAGIGGIPTAIFAVFVNFDGGGFGDASWESGGIVDFDGGIGGDDWAGWFGDFECDFLGGDVFFAGGR